MQRLEVSVLDGRTQGLSHYYRCKFSHGIRIKTETCPCSTESRRHCLLFCVFYGLFIDYFFTHLYVNYIHQHFILPRAQRNKYSNWDS